METGTVVPQNITSKITICNNNSISGYISKRIESKIWRRYLYTCVLSRIIYNNQWVEATRVSNSRWMDMPNVEYTYNGMLFSREGNPRRKHNIDETWRYYAKWNKQVTKGQIMWFHLHEVPTAIRFIEKKVESCLPGALGRGKWEVVVYWVKRFSLEKKKEF